KVLDAGLARLIDGVLNQRSVNNGQHFLGQGLGGRQETCAKTGNGKNGCSDARGQKLSLRAVSAGKAIATLLEYHERNFRCNCRELIGWRYWSRGAQATLAVTWC